MEEKYKAIRVLLRTLLLAVLVLVTAGILISLLVEDDEEIFNDRLEERISAGEEKIPLKELTNFDWDRVCYIRSDPDGDYNVDDEDISAIIGFPYSGLNPTEMCDTFAYNALVFSKASTRIATVIDMKRCSPRIGEDRRFLKRYGSNNIYAESYRCFSEDVYFLTYDDSFGGEKFRHVTFIDGK